MNSNYYCGFAEYLVSFVSIGVNWACKTMYLFMNLRMYPLLVLQYRLHQDLLDIDSFSAR